jgi:hypothetical protein
VYFSTVEDITINSLSTDFFGSSRCLDNCKPLLFTIGFRDVGGGSWGVSGMRRCYPVFFFCIFLNLILGFRC